MDDKLEVKQQKFKIVYLAHGRAGNEYLDILSNYLINPDENLLVYSYDNPDNQSLRNKCKDLSVKFKTLNVNNDIESLKVFNPDLVVCIHYRHFVKTEVLNIAKCGGVNLHPSLLPKYRGTFSAPWVIINREDKTGITYHFMNNKFDDGNIVNQVELNLDKTETAFQLFHKLIDLGKENLIDTLNKILVEKTAGEKQVGTFSYYERRLPFDGIINPFWDEEKIEAFIRAMHFPPFTGALLPTHEGLKEVNSFKEYKDFKSDEDTQKTIVVSAMAFGKKSPEEIIEIARLNNMAVEFSSGMAYRHDMKDVYLNAPVKKYIHNYFPAPAEPFVLNLASTNEEIRISSIKHSKQGLELAAKSNCPFYSVHAGFCVDPHFNELGELFKDKIQINRTENKKQFKKSLKELLEFADVLGVNLFIENNVVIKENLEYHGEDPFLCTTPEELIELINEMDNNRLKILLDTAHLKVSSNTLSFNLEQAALSLEKYIGAIHHSDNNGLRDTNNEITADYWFLPFMERFAEIVHVLEVKNIEIEKIKDNMNRLSCSITKVSNRLRTSC